MSNKTIIQYFQWYLPKDGGHWQRTAEDAAHLAELGITDAWLPPAYKGHEGMGDVGYGVYDLYDLGEFDQKNTIPTKYGTKDDYLAAIDALHANGIRVLADIVLNHRMGADYCEDAIGTKVEKKNRYAVKKKEAQIKVWTGFNFPGRNKKYSSFEWNQSHFSGVDWDELTKKKYIFLLNGHDWSYKVDDERGNFDYLMGADVDFTVPEVREELINWGKWYLDTTKVDGFRLDAVKHISYAFFPEWLEAMRSYAGKELFAVGEYWSTDLNRLTKFLNNAGKFFVFEDLFRLRKRKHTTEQIVSEMLKAKREYGGAENRTLEEDGPTPRKMAGYLKGENTAMSLFDVPLQNNFKKASDAKSAFKLNEIFKGSLLEVDSEHAVTFVDNHDTQETQALHNWVAAWFKPLAYALILLRRLGTPCVFYGDMYGIEYENVNPVRELETLLKARKDYAYGKQTDYFDDEHTIGWTREGGELGGMAVVMTNSDKDQLNMKLGKPGQVYVDLLGNRSEEIVIGEDGSADFTVNKESISIWVPKK